MPPSSAGLTPKGVVVNNRRRAMAFSRTLQWDHPAPTQPIRAVTLRASTHQLRIFARDPQGSHGPTLTKDTTLVVCRDCCRAQRRPRFGGAFEDGARAAGAVA